MCIRDSRSTGEEVGAKTLFTKWMSLKLLDSILIGSIFSSLYDVILAWFLMALRRVFDTIIEYSCLIFAFNWPKKEGAARSSRYFKISRNGNT